MARNTRSATDKWTSRTNPTPPANTVPAICPAARTSFSAHQPSTRHRRLCCSPRAPRNSQYPRRPFDLGSGAPHPAAARRRRHRLPGVVRMAASRPNRARYHASSNAQQAAGRGVLPVPFPAGDCKHPSAGVADRLRRTGAPCHRPVNCWLRHAHQLPGREHPRRLLQQCRTVTRPVAVGPPPDLVGQGLDLIRAPSSARHRIRRHKLRGERHRGRCGRAARSLFLRGVRHAPWASGTSP